MTHLSIRAAASSAVALVTLVVASAADVQAQFAAYPTPTVTYSPVIAAPTVVAAPVVVQPRLGFFDRWRLRRWGMTAPVVAAPSYTAAYAPAYAAAYAPTYTAAYAPSYTAAYAPAPAYVTSYAPLQQPVVTTSYMPVAAPSSCSSCAQTSYAPVVTTQYAPMTVYRPTTAVLAPVVAEPACTTCSYGCATCAPAAPCASCSACAVAPVAAEVQYADQASYAVAAPAAAPACSACATASGEVQYPSSTGGTQNGSPGTGGGPPTPPPTVPAPQESYYLAPQPEGDALSAPDLFNPNGDRTASAPTVDIHPAVYRRPASAATVSAARPVSSTSAVDATPWGR